MLENMRFYHSEADRLLAIIVAGKKPTVELVEAMKGMCEFRSEAQKCAVDAAVFVHPRLAAVAVGIKGNDQPLRFTLNIFEAAQEPLPRPINGDGLINSDGSPKH
jgi:hypothetical protein